MRINDIKQRLCNHIYTIFKTEIKLKDNVLYFETMKIVCKIGNFILMSTK